MKKIILLAGVACLFAANASAREIAPYISLKAKYSMMKNDLKVQAKDPIYNYQGKGKVDDEVPGGAIALGYDTITRFGDFRTELEYNYNGDAKKTIYGLDAKVKTQAAFMNMYFDFNTNTRFMPYIGGGLGATKMRGSLYEDRMDDTSFAWNVGAGFVIHFSRYVAMDVGYRYVDYGKFTQKIDVPGWYENDRLESTAHEVLAGLRFTF